MKSSETRASSDMVPAVGRRRIGLFAGVIGVASRVALTGQIVDVPILETHLSEDWHPFASLPASLMRRFRAVQDAGMNPVRGPRLNIEVVEAREDMDPRQAPVLAGLNDVQGTGSTQFRLPLFSVSTAESLAMEPLPPGRYILRVSLRGVDSIRQNLVDLAFLGTGSNQFTQTDMIAGYARLLILPEEYQGPIVTSDVDQTYLDTKVGDRDGLVEALFERAESKVPLPGMNEFYRALQARSAPLIFLSASPSFFRRTLEAVFELQQINHDGLALKNLLGPLSNIARKAFEVIANIEDYLTQGVNEAVERSVKFLGSSYQSMLDQVAYKLTALLEQRLSLPHTAREFLIGDNTESDFLIFTLYQILLGGRLAPGEIEDFCYHLRFHNREAITRDGARRIRELVEQNLAIHGPGSPVQAVWIHQVKLNMNSDDMRRHMEEVLPEGTLVGDTITLPVAYENAFELALLALNHMLIEPGDVLEIGMAMQGKTLRDRIIEPAALLSVVDRFPFRKEVHRDYLRGALLSQEKPE